MSANATRLGPNFSYDAAIAGLSDAAFRTHVEALQWSNERLLDLVLPKHHLRRFAETDDLDAAAAELVAVGWWDDRGDAWYLAYGGAEQSRDRARAEGRRAQNAEAQRRRRRRMAGVDEADAPLPPRPASLPRPRRHPAASQNGPTDLYRWYDVDGVLLYVGITVDRERRERDHARGSMWSEFAVTSKVETLPSRVEAERAERSAVHNERPIFNRKHNDTPEARAALVDYLLAKGRKDLLAAAVARS